MWRRILSSKTLTIASATAGKASPPCRSASAVARLVDRAPGSASASLLFARNFSADSDDWVKKKVDEKMPIATGAEREELEAEVKGIDLSDLDHPHGPFGTKEAPAIIKSTFDKRIVGCPGGEGDDEHDVVWFWLEKDKPHICPVCSQYFMLQVVGNGGIPHEWPGNDDDYHLQ